MVVIENCEDKVGTTNGTVSNNVDIVEQYPQIVQTKQGSGPRRVSQRLEKRPRKYWGNDKKKRVISGTDGNHFIKKRKTKLVNVPSVQQRRALVSVGESSVSNTSSNSNGCEVACVAGGEDNNNGSIVFDELDYRGALRIRETLRRSNGVNFGKRLPVLRGSEKLIEKIRGIARSVNEVHFAKGKITREPSSYPYLVCSDLSNGLEAIPIPVTNEVDDPPIAPAAFTYVTSTQVANNVEVPSSDGYGCQCEGSCRTSKTCCAKLNNKFPYTSRRKCSRLIKAKDIVFECGPNCGCGPDCANRVSQKGLQYRLEVFRTPNKGWGVRSWDYIPFGALVCEYVGVLRKSEDLNDATNNDFLFDIDCWERIKSIGGRKKRLPDEPLPEQILHEKEDEDATKNEPEFCVDSSSFGNVARFINHSCVPNLFVQCVLSSHYGVKQARVALFAGKRIRPNTELTYDYSYQLDSVVDADGNIKQSPCYCGEVTCRKRLY